MSGHGHSHGGAPCHGHGHSHAEQPPRRTQHGGGHGHSHGGVACGGHHDEEPEEPPKVLTPIEQMWFSGVAKGQIPIVQKLVAKGFDVNTTCDDAFQNALFFAVQHQNMELYKELRAAGALLNIPGNRGVTTLRVAVQFRHEEFIKLILEEDPSLVNIPDWEGNAPLAVALRTCDSDIVRCLLAAGADINHLDEEGTTPLINACELKRADLIESLIEVGSDVNFQDPHGRFPLLLVSVAGDTRNAAKLLEKGANVNATTMGGHLALSAAAQSGSIDLIKLLLSKGANPSLNHNDGTKPADFTKVEAIKELLEAVRSGSLNPEDLGELCISCGKVGKKKLCAGCRAIAYCSSECQKSHWRIHRDSCVKK